MTNEELYANFVYEDGWLRRVGGRVDYPWRYVGAGYLATTFNGTTYYLHHLVWQYVTGEPAPMLDHRDRITENCMFENLRPCTAGQNQHNSKRKANNRSGHKGVVFCPRLPYRPWHAQIVVDGVKHGLGYYATPEEAGAAYAAGAASLAGEFARAA